MLRKSWAIIAGASLTLAGTSCTEQKPDAVAGTAAAAPAALCALTQAEFNGWKAAGGAPGFAAPDSTTFQSTSDCAFYKWASQMFLWLTTQDASGTMTMFSPTFYTAVESTESGKFALVRNPSGSANSLKSGRPATIKFLTRVNKPVTMETHTPAQLAAARAKVDSDVENGDFDMPSSGSTGQAGGGVLVMKGDKVDMPGKPGYATYPVAYYAIQVNDVFAGLQANQTNVPYYTSGSSAGDFPTTAPQAQQIETAAGTTYPDANQLALEVKSSWVDTAYLTPEQTAGLITIQGEVPAFQEKKKKGKKDGKDRLILRWDGKTTAVRTLALVGIHVTGTVAGHPEMVWATFESEFNSPDNTYSYINSGYDPATKACSGGSCISTVTFATSSATPTIFYTGQSGAAAPPDNILETAKSAAYNTAIHSRTDQLVATNVVRYNPWGSQQPATPSLTDPVVLNNTMLLSLKTTLNAQLTGMGGQGTIFANYFQIGSLWANNNIIPPQTGYKEFGSLFLANTTMETFQQVSSQNHNKNASANNCFNCHGQFGTSPGTSVSHVFPNVVPAPTPTPTPSPTPSATPTPAQ